MYEFTDDHSLTPFLQNKKKRKKVKRLDLILDAEDPMSFLERLQRSIFRREDVKAEYVLEMTNLSRPLLCALITSNSQDCDCSIISDSNRRQL